MVHSHDTIKVTVDKSHLVTLGERLYVESVELFRELISNAYDADATEVYVRLGEDVIVVEDNGSGMNRRDLEQYFNIGSSHKRTHLLSPRFGRKRIGQFGIGKFAVLTTAREFNVESRKKKYVYQVMFSKENWEQGESWELPIHKEPATNLHHQGTKITLSKLKGNFTPAEVQRYLQEVLPLRAKKFSIFLNGARISTREVAGRHHPFSFKTMYGVIQGDVIVAHYSGSLTKPGLACRVKGMLIKKFLFGIDPRQQGVGRISGWVEADFLPVTSARSEFVRDDLSYKLFEKVVRAELEKVLKTVKHAVDKRQLAKMEKTLKDVLNQLRGALKENPDLVPSARVLARRAEEQKKRAKDIIASARVPDKQESKKENARQEVSRQNKESTKKENLPTTYMKRFRVAKFGITCGFAHLGKDGPEVTTEGKVIYINQDHPVYVRLYPKRHVLSFHLLRLISQEVVLMKKMRMSAREAFEVVGRLMRDAIG